MNFIDYAVFAILVVKLIVIFYLINTLSSENYKKQTNIIFWLGMSVLALTILYCNFREYILL